MDVCAEHISTEGLGGQRVEVVAKVVTMDVDEDALHCCAALTRTVE